MRAGTADEGFWTVGDRGEEPTTSARQRRESTRDVPGSRVHLEARAEGKPVRETGKGSGSWSMEGLEHKAGPGLHPRAPLHRACRPVRAADINQTPQHVTTYQARKREVEDVKPGRGAKLAWGSQGWLVVGRVTEQQSEG